MSVVVIGIFSNSVQGIYRGCNPFRNRSRNCITCNVNVCSQHPTFASSKFHYALRDRQGLERKGMLATYGTAPATYAFVYYSDASFASRSRSFSLSIILAGDEGFTQKLQL